MDYSKVVILRSFATIGEASVFKALLEASGVQCALLNETIASILPIGGDLTKINLVVEEDDLAKAEETLSAQFDEVEFDSESRKRHKRP